MESTKNISVKNILDADDESWSFQTHSSGPSGKIPFTEEILIEESSGFHFGMSQSAGMGWNPAELLRKHFLILSTSGGMREPDGSPVALGLHTGHYELALQVEQAAREIKKLKGIPFSLYCSDPCDGRTNGATGMMDSLP